MIINGDEKVLKKDSIFSEDDFLATYVPKDTNYEVYRMCFYLGCASFGGFVANFILFNEKFVIEKKFITEIQFNQLVVLCTSIPGGSTIQLLVAIVTIRTKSILGGIIGLVMFDLPWLTLTIILSLLIEGPLSSWENDSIRFFLTSFSVGLKQGILAIIFRAILIMLITQKYNNSIKHVILTLVCAFIYLIFRYTITIFILMAICGVLFWKFSFFDNDDSRDSSDQLLMTKFNYIKSRESFESFEESSDSNFVCSDLTKDIFFLGIPAFLVLCFGFLLFSLIEYFFKNNNIILLAKNFYKIGAIAMEGSVFPILLSELEKIIEPSTIINAWSISEMLPAAKYNMAGYIGTKLDGWTSGYVSVICIFTSSILVLFTVLKFIDFFNSNPQIKKLILGFSIAAKGILVSSFLLYWYFTCYYKPHYHVVIGTVNSIICTIVTKLLRINILYSLLIASVYSIIFSYLLCN